MNDFFLFIRRKAFFFLASHLWGVWITHVGNGPISSHDVTLRMNYETRSDWGWHTYCEIVKNF